MMISRGHIILLGTLVLSGCVSRAQEAQDYGWRISPEKINIQVGNDRALQVLDDELLERVQA